jgi:homoserine kinase
LALEGPVDEVEAELTDEGAVILVHIFGDDGRLPREAEKNCAGVAARAVLDRFGSPGAGVRLWLHKGLSLGTGLGSSAASSVAGALATAALVAPDLPREALLDACREGERLATGSPHPDNVAPSLLGGLVACVTQGGEAVDALRLPVAEGIFLVTVSPALELPTIQARAVMPAQYPLSDVVANMGRIAGLCAAFASGDLERMGACLEDRLATPYRKALIPAYDAVMAAARLAGSVGGGISGAGPTLFALAQDREEGGRIGRAMAAAFNDASIPSVVRVSGINLSGARLL